MNFAVHRAWIVATALLSAAPLLAQEPNPAVEQSRLFQRSAPPTPGNITADGMALPAGESTSAEDGSFGAQEILKAQEKIPQFTLSGGSSLFYTSNVALTRDATISDGFYVGQAGFNWTPQINPTLQFQFGAGFSLFRYFETSVLDFESLGAGVGLTWAPQNFWGLALVGRYDFTELLDKHSNEILQDHEFSLALQKIIPLGRSHALSLAVLGSAGISDPFAEQRDQIGFAIGYHLQLTRQIGSDFGYRLSGFFYNGGGRDDLNQILSLGVHYYIRPWASVEGYLSGAFNSSNRSSFDYNVFSAGGGASLSLHF